MLSIIYDFRNYMITIPLKIKKGKTFSPQIGLRMYQCILNDIKTDNE